MMLDATNSIHIALLVKYQYLPGCKWQYWWVARVLGSWQLRHTTIYLKVDAQWLIYLLHFEVSRLRPQETKAGGPKMQEINQNLAMDLIEPNHTIWASLVVFVLEKGTLSFCVDHRKLTAVMTQNLYLIPCMDRFVASVGGAKVFGNWS